jgi:uncharacterized membrane protein YhaH (DUF805 family)
MRWFWYILSANLAIGTITLLEVYKKPIFKKRSTSRKIQAIIALYLLGVLVMLLALISLDWRNRNDKQNPSV